MALPRDCFSSPAMMGKICSSFPNGENGGTEGRLPTPRGRAVLYKGKRGARPSVSEEGSPPRERVHGRTFRRVCFVPRALSQHLWRLQWLKKKGSVEQFGYKQELHRTLSLWDLTVYGVLFMVIIAPHSIFGYVNRDAQGMAPLVYLVGFCAMLFFLRRCPTSRWRNASPIAGACTRTCSAA